MPSLPPLSLRLLLAAALLAPLAWPPAPASAQESAQARARKLEQEREAEKKRALEKQFPLGVNWMLEDVGGKRPPAGVEVTLRIDKTLRGTGTAGCNTFSAAMYPARGQTIVAGPPALTRRTCPPPVMAFERAFLQGLYSRPQWDQNGDQLTMKTRTGLMRFRRSF
ncbi:MAG: META domain-containing protein [Beijerinckiaceae bacterium]|nr:META domain-containing protein [Beijerinckiaceae bacterium]